MVNNFKKKKNFKKMYISTHAMCDETESKSK